MLIGGMVTRAFLEDELQGQRKVVWKMSRVRISESRVRLMWCCGLNCVSPNSYIEALTTNVTIFRDKAFKKVITVKPGQRVGSNPAGPMSLEEEYRHEECVVHRGEACERPMRWPRLQARK